MSANQDPGGIFLTNERPGDKSLGRPPPGSSMTQLIPASETNHQGPVRLRGSDNTLVATICQLDLANPDR